MTRKISPERARDLAYQWHGGQSSPLYAFASSGIVRDRDALLSEIDECRCMAERCAGYLESDREQCRELWRWVNINMPEGEGRAPWAKDHAAA